MDLFFEKCRQHNLRITPQRTSIYQAVVDAKNHPSTDDIYQIVRREHANVSFDTVNRTLMTFTQIGLLTVAESYKGMRRYDPNVDTHHHMHCLKCGRIVDFAAFPAERDCPAGHVRDSRGAGYGRSNRRRWARGHG